jgi:hypothetical protein
MAGGRNTTSSSNGRLSLPPLCRPADAARAYLTALNLVPDVSAGSSSSSSSHDAASAAAAAGLFGDPVQLRRQLQSKLNAAQELLSDAEQTAVLAAAAAAAAAAAGVAGKGSSGVQGSCQLALMQLGLPAAPQADKVQCHVA